MHVSLYRFMYIVCEVSGTRNYILVFYSKTVKRLKSLHG